MPQSIKNYEVSFLKKCFIPQNKKASLFMFTRTTQKIFSLAPYNIKSLLKHTSLFQNFVLQEGCTFLNIVGVFKIVCKGRSPVVRSWPFYVNLCDFFFTEPLQKRNFFVSYFSSQTFRTTPTDTSLE